LGPYTDTSRLEFLLIRGKRFNDGSSLNNKNEEGDALVNDIGKATGYTAKNG